MQRIFLPFHMYVYTHHVLYSNILQATSSMDMEEQWTGQAPLPRPNTTPTAASRSHTMTGGANHQSTMMCRTGMVRVHSTVLSFISIACLCLNVFVWVLFNWIFYKHDIQISEYHIDYMFYAKQETTHRVADGRILCAEKLMLFNVIYQNLSPSMVRLITCYMMWVRSGSQPIRIPPNTSHGVHSDA